MLHSTMNLVWKEHIFLPEKDNDVTLVDFPLTVSDFTLEYILLLSLLWNWTVTVEFVAN